jgi:hypothetical protein
MMKTLVDQPSGNSSCANRQFRMDHPRPIEPDAHPRWRKRNQTDGTTALPADLLHEPSIRIQLIYVLGSVLWTVNLAMDHFWAPQGDRGPYRSLIEMLGDQRSGASPPTGASVLSVSGQKNSGNMW